MTVIVADTGPLVHLHEAQALHLLPLAGDILVTPQVLTEWKSLSRALRPDPIPDWIKTGVPSVAALQQAEGWLKAGLLHAGEAESLALAIERSADWLLTDDAAARLLATSLGVETHGSLGVILWAAAQRHISRADADHALDRLEQSTLWLSARVRAQARQALERLCSKPD
jgi:predicted nucleic acid-binding protein